MDWTTIWYKFLMRNNAWLRSRLERIWQEKFPDIPSESNIVIMFGQKARTRLGSIKKNRVKDAVSKITMTGYFEDERVPEIIVDLTIAHELCHYAHGFSSPLPQLYRFPHQGNIVDRDLMRRGYGDDLIFQKKWLREKWPEIVGRSQRRIVHRRRKSRSIIQELINLLN